MFRNISIRRMSSVNLVELAKRTAAYQAVDEHLPPNPKVIGVGSGSTVIYAVERLGQLKDKLSKTTFVPSGFQSKQLILQNGLTLGSIDQYTVGDLDVAFDGADEVDRELKCIKGGGACLFQEKLVSLCAKKFVVIADSRKISDKLGTKWVQGVPIEVVPMAYPKVMNDLEKLGAKTVTLREGGKAKAGPVVTDNCNFLLDVDFGPIEPENVMKLHQQIKQLVGVVETGLFDNAEIAYFGLPDGTVEVRKLP